MGKRKQRGGNKDGEAQKRRKSKNGGSRRCWVESCKGNKIPKAGCPNGSLIIHISRIELSDDHTHGGAGADSNTSIQLEDSIDQKGSLDIAQKGSLDISLSTAVDAESGESKQLEGEQGNIDVKETKAETELESKSGSPLPIDGKKNQEELDFSKAFIKTTITPSAKGHLKWFQMNNVGKKRRRKKDVILPNGDCGDGVCNPFSTDEVPNKYWAQRKRFFQKFDDGVQLDKESWYSVTPEKIARHLGFRMSTFFKTQNGGKSESNGAVILDAFCGCGGNAIGFASQENISLVICVDIDRNKLRMAANNAKIYGIDPKKMRFVVANAIDVIESYSNGDLHSEDKKSSITCEEQEIVEGFTIGTIGLLPQTIDTIFLSPPWGGMDYLREGKNGYNISDCIKIVRQITKEEKTSNEQDESEFLNGEELLVIAAKSARAGKVMYFLPRNINGVSLGRSALKAGYCNSIELEQNYLNGKLKTVTTYMDKEL